MSILAIDPGTTRMRSGSGIAWDGSDAGGWSRSMTRPQSGRFSTGARSRASRGLGGSPTAGRSTRSWSSCRPESRGQMHAPSASGNQRAFCRVQDHGPESSRRFLEGVASMGQVQVFVRHFPELQNVDPALGLAFCFLPTHTRREAAQMPRRREMTM